MCACTYKIRLVCFNSKQKYHKMLWLTTQKSLYTQFQKSLYTQFQLLLQAKQKAYLLDIESASCSAIPSQVQYLTEKTRFLCFIFHFSLHTGILITTNPRNDAQLRVGIYYVTSYTALCQKFGEIKLKTIICFIWW